MPRGEIRGVTEFELPPGPMLTLASVSILAVTWETLTAIGTLAAAGATVLVALVTLSLVRATHEIAAQGEEDMRAQWRPVLLVRDEIPESVRSHKRGTRYAGGQLDVYVENVGRGPALDVQASLDGFDQPGPGTGRPEGAQPVHGMGTLIHPALGPRDLRCFIWTGLGETHQAVSGSFSYLDLSGTGFFATKFFIRFDPERGAELISQGVETDSPGS